MLTDHRKTLLLMQGYLDLVRACIRTSLADPGCSDEIRRNLEQLREETEAMRDTVKRALDGPRT
jgi:hypothetical protein